MKTYKIAIVGAGPSGYFTAQALQNAANDERNFKIDLIERLPTPWGLVRSGVAPDHPKIKSVSKVFEKIASDPNFRLFANVEIGKDINLADLKEKYDAVVLCTGSSIGKKLGIPGEELTNSISAAEFVPWYNGHPDFENSTILQAAAGQSMLHLPRQNFANFLILNIPMFISMKKPSLLQFREPVQPERSRNTLLAI